MVRWPMVEGECAYCGSKGLDHPDEHYLLECPLCLRPGCPDCIPSGRYCLCPECEEARDE